MFKYLFLTVLLTYQASQASLLIEGVSDELLKKLQTDLPVSKKTNPTQADVDSIIRYIVLTKDFQNVSAFQKQNRINIIAYPLRTIEELIIKGNKSFSETQVMESLKIKTGSNFEKRKILDAGERLKTFYGESGFFNAQIEIAFANKSENSLAVTFNIKEGSPTIIEDVIFNSSNKELNIRLRKVVSSFIRSPFSKASTSEIEQKTREFFKEKSYLRAEIRQERVEYDETKSRARLFYNITHPSYYKLRVIGNQQLPQATVFRGISIHNFEVSSIDPAVKVEENALQTYLERGYAQSKVSAKSIPDRENPFKNFIAINIEEGPLVTIDKLEITGRISRSQKYYSNFIKENSSSAVEKGLYNKEALQVGYENLITHLKNQGFLRAKLQSARVDFSKDKKKAHILVVIDEGPLTQIRKIRFSGAKAFDPIKLQEVLNLKTNSPLRLYQLEESILKLKQHYHRNGFIEVKILNEDENLIQYNKTGTEANITFQLSEGPKVFVKSISIDGNYKTKDRVILRAINFKVGDIVTFEKIEESKQELNALGIFSRLNIRTLEENTPISGRALIVSVTERDPGLFRFGFGANSEVDLTARTYIGASYSNLFGTARGITGRVELSSNVNNSLYLQRRVILGYIEPFLFGQKLKGRFNVIHSINEENYDQDEKVSDLEERNKLSLRVEKQWGKHFKLTWNTWSIDAIQEFQAPALPEIFVKSRTSVATIGPTFELDYRDNPYLPTRGTYTWWATDYSKDNFGSTDGIDFIRTEANVSFYTPIFGSSIVWANAIRGGYLENLNRINRDIPDQADNPGVPNAYTFSLHGQSKVRGYGGSNSINHIPSITESGTTDFNVLTQSEYYLFKTELRFPLPGFDFLNLAIFYDLGAVVIDDVDKRDSFSNPQRSSYGLGFHFQTPVGPVRIEYARKTNLRTDSEGNKEAADRIHISIGSF